MTVDDGQVTDRSEKSHITTDPAATEAGNKCSLTGFLMMSWSSAGDS